MPGLNTNNTHNACDIYRGGCSHPQGPYRRNIFSETLLLELDFRSSISGATRSNGKVKERENKSPVPEDGVSAGETQQDTQSWPEF